MSFVETLNEKDWIREAIQPHDDIVLATKANEQNRQPSSFSAESWRVVAHIPMDGGDVWVFGRADSDD